MATISFNPVQDGNTATAADVNTPFETIVDAINGNIDTINLADDAVTTAKIADDAVGEAQLATGAILLGYDNRDTNVSYGGAITAISGLEVTVTVPSGKKIEVEMTAPYVSNSTANSVTLSLWEGAVSSGTQLTTASWLGQNSNDRAPLIMRWIYEPTAGSKTYTVGIATAGGTATVLATMQLSVKAL